MSNLLISEDFVDKKKEMRLGSTEVYETVYSSVKELYLALRKQYGKCVSSIYVDSPGKAKSRRIGWVFEKKEKYIDSKEEYLRETWVTVHKDFPVTKTEYQYFYLP